MVAASFGIPTREQRAVDNEEGPALCVGSRVRNEGARPARPRHAVIEAALASACSTCELSHVAALRGMRRRVKRLEGCGSASGARATRRGRASRGRASDCSETYPAEKLSNICSRLLFKNVTISSKATSIWQKKGTRVCVRSELCINLFLLNHWFYSELKTCLVQSNANQCRLFYSAATFLPHTPSKSTEHLVPRRNHLLVIFHYTQAKAPDRSLSPSAHPYIGHREDECGAEE